MPTTNTQVVTIGELRAHTDNSDGDSLVGLDNGYVVEIEDADYVSLASNSGRLPEDMKLITFHTAEGDEAYLIAPENMPVTIRERRA